MSHNNSSTKSSRLIAVFLFFYFLGRNLINQVPHFSFRKMLISMPNLRSVIFHFDPPLYMIFGAIRNTIFRVLWQFPQPSALLFSKVFSQSYNRLMILSA